MYIIIKLRVKLTLILGKVIDITKEGVKEYTDFSELDTHELKSAIKKSMFDEIYTMKNHKVTREEDIEDPLHLKRCMRIFPQQQNTGGFFLAGLTKKRVEGEIIFDELYEMDPYTNKNVRQRSMQEEADLFEKKMQELGIMEKKAGSDEEEKKEERKIIHWPSTKWDDEQIEPQIQFSQKDNDFQMKLVSQNQQVWSNLKLFYGIDDAFPLQYLYFHSNNNINLVNKGVQYFVSLKDRHKLKVKLLFYYALIAC